MEIFDWQDQDVFLISGDAQYIVKGHDLHVKSLSHLQMYWPHLFPTDLSLWNYKANRNYALIHLSHAQGVTKLTPARLWQWPHINMTQVPLGSFLCDNYEHKTDTATEITTNCCYCDLV